MQRKPGLLIAMTLASGAGLAADRAITVAPAVQMSWEYLTPGTQVRPSRSLGVGFFNLTPGKLTVVLADQGIAGASQGMAPAAPARAAMPLPPGAFRSAPPR